MKKMNYRDLNLKMANKQCEIKYYPSQMLVYSIFQKPMFPPLRPGPKRSEKNAATPSFT
jgi:hypothetical protein